jgi:hypothetical protein
MSDANCNCCGCQYATPPWWVTMGFIPPNNPSGQVQSPGSTFVNPGTVHPGTVVTAPPATQPGHTGTPAVGGLLGQLVNLPGQVAGTVLGAPLNAAGNVVDGIVKGLGGILGGLGGLF